MGNEFSCGQVEDNDDLINILKFHGYINSVNIERVFRAVDRGDYILESQRDLAYKDMSCKVGNIHLSAPCIYSKVMEGLCLEPGLSFLNIGSGTGYFSTMAGLILGQNGTNHGIELHKDCLEYAKEHLEDFKQKSLDLDVFEFCEPVFHLGNFLNAIPNRQYDRVYCGAACPESYQGFVKQFVKVGGILVMPYKDRLLKIKRKSENTWSNNTMLPVSFASLIVPHDELDQGLLQLPLCKPHTLQELCRNLIRRQLRKIVWSEHSDLESKTPIQERGGFTDRANYDRSHIMATTLHLVMGSPMQAVFIGSSGDSMGGQVESDDSDDSVIDRMFRDDSEDENVAKETKNTETDGQEDSGVVDDHKMEEDVDENGDDKTLNVTKEKGNIEKTKETEDVEMRDETMERGEQSGSKNIGGSSGVNMKRKSTAKCSNDSSDESEHTTIDDTDDDDLEMIFLNKVYSILKADQVTVISDSDPSTSSDEEYDADNATARRGAKATKSSARNTETTGDEATTRKRDHDGVSSDSELENFRPLRKSFFLRAKRDNGGSGSKKRVAAKQETDDSQADKSVTEKDEKKEAVDNIDTIISDSSSNDEEENAIANQRELRAGQKRCSQRKLRQCETSTDDGDDSDVEMNIGRRTSPKKGVFAHRIHKEKFSLSMKRKINELPLPLPLRLYINYNREL